MALPKISIEFFSKLKPRSRRDPAGIVALILADDTQTDDTFIYTPSSNVSGWSADNQEYIRLAFEGGPRKVIVERVDAAAESYDAALSRLRNKRFDYMAIPGIDAADTMAVSTWLADMRDVNRKMFKAVLPNTAANDESVINFTSTGMRTVDGREYTTAEYTARIAGVLAGLPFNRSATFYIMDELAYVDEVADPDAAVDAGELILINDGENIKIGRGVNSLVTIREEDGKSEDWKSIRVVDIMDMIHDEIYYNFVNNYVGKVPNTYDNQVLFINEINRAFDELEALELIADEGENQVWVDVDAQREAWEMSGVDTTDWDDQRVKESAYKRHVFLAGKLRLIETMEDLEFNIEI